ncbi:MAG: LysM peptidoglycan-binding domain-containing protein [Planctomycetes bacterium]|nr:LysM peptidoglycan-binding domain-containing protein [Planctomycetota bacterium]
MNKPAKLLVAVAVLAFAAAGLYYAWLAPAKKASTTPTVKLTRQDQEGPKAPAETAGRDLRESPTMPASAMPTPVPTTSAPTAPAGVPASAFADPKPASSVPGFVPANEPIKPLPSEGVPGFAPAPNSTSAVITTTGGAPATGAAVPVPPPASSAAPAATAPASVPAATTTPATPIGGVGAKPSASPATSPASAPSALPPLPAPAKTATVPAPVSTIVSTPKSTKADTYTVKEGDSIVSIWRSLSGSERGWEKLLAANPGVDPSRLKIGQVLKVPDAAPASPTGTSQSTSTAPTTKTSGATTYTVESGDTLHRIANKVYGDSKLWNQIYEANKSTIGSDPAALKVGMKLQIPAKSGAPGKTEAKEPSKSSATTGASTPSAPR